MDRLIRTAWRAFWVGLGASAVLIGQTVLAPAQGPAVPADPAAAPLVAPAPMLSPAAVRRRAADPVLSRNPLDPRPGPLSIRCETVANVTRCS